MSIKSWLADHKKIEGALFTIFAVLFLYAFYIFIKDPKFLLIPAEILIALIAVWFAWKAYEIFADKDTNSLAKDIKAAITPSVTTPAASSPVTPPVT